MTVHTKKCCRVCGAVKALKGFYIERHGRHASMCKLCRRAQVAQWRQTTLETRRDKDRQRDAQPERRAYKREYLQRYLKTARGRESRRVAQRVYRAWRKAQGLPPFPSDRPEAIAARRERMAQRQSTRQEASSP